MNTYCNLYFSGNRSVLFPFYTRHDCRRGLVSGYPKPASFGPRPLFDSVRHFIVKHTPFKSVVTSNDSILNRAPSKKSFFNQKSIFWNKLILASSSVTEIRDTLVCCPDRRVGFVAKGAEEGAQSCVVLRFRWWEEGFMVILNHNFARHLMMGVFPRVCSGVLWGMRKSTVSGSCRIQCSFFGVGGIGNGKRRHRGP